MFSLSEPLPFGSQLWDGDEKSVPGHGSDVGSVWRGKRRKEMEEQGNTEGTEWSAGRVPHTPASSFLIKH